MHEEKDQQEEAVLEIDLLELIGRFLKGLRKLWMLVVFLSALCAVVGLVYSSYLYRPMYRAEASFTVKTDNQQEGKMLQPC